MPRMGAKGKDYEHWAEGRGHRLILPKALASANDDRRLDYADFLKNFLEPRTGSS